ncbi:IS1/IS1595 family N-terminal zinc-binding domain-containing protein [Magnetofaba australis]|uniref:Putative insertion element protein n=1 Tax=Magnetofaba australis IT-1 TaxID=1434232 RepID=A0A1Y2K9V7_9PROT|nr:IS1 family transposase [Magnetofaba australis]OSM08454.1 putative insertion element protein [Magnetofaba australis IT-1]
MATVEIPVRCPDCGSLDVIKFGKHRNGEQRYRCNNGGCERTIFMLDDASWMALATLKNAIAHHLINGYGIAQTADHLGVHPELVTQTLAMSPMQAQAARRMVL